MQNSDSCPQVSIIIVNYNTFAMTLRCIESVLSYPPAVPFEIILVDNASTECDPEMFTERCDALRLIKSSENVGFAAGCNIGIAASKGDYILLLNSDVEFTEDAITPALRVFEAETEPVAVVAVALRFPDGRLQPSYDSFSSFGREVSQLLRLSKLRALFGQKDGVEADKEVEILDTDWVWGTYFLVPRALIDALPLRRLSQRFFMYQEDVEWCYHFKQLGYRVCYLPKVSVVHHFAGSVSKSTLRRERIIIENDFAFEAERRGYLLAVCLFAIRILYLVSLRKRIFLQRALMHVEVLRCYRAGGESKSNS